VCGDDWMKHSSATGGFYSCNRYAPPPDQATADASDSAGPGLRAFLGSVLGKIQVWALDLWRSLIWLA
jgi:hypothetical protein